MDSVAPASLDSLFSAWNGYTTHGKIDPSTRPLVRESWERCERYGLSPRTLPPQQEDPERLASLRERSRALCRAAEPYLQRVHQALGHWPHLVALADADGNIVRLLADATAEQLGEGANLFEGASWHERDIGCNGIGTALAAGEPVILIGPEHYLEPYGTWTCLGIPIRDADEAVVGALDLSVPNESVNPTTWGWMLDVAAGIEATVRDAAGAAPAEVADRADAPLQAVRGVLEFLGREETLSGGHQDFIRAAVEEVESAERWLRRATEREAFGSMLAHEVRNPLSVILGQAIRLERQLHVDDPRVADAVSELRAAAERLNELITHTLLLAEPEPELSQLEALFLGGLVDDAVREAGLSSAVAVDIRPEVPAVLGNPIWLRQILVNLLSNARKYSEPGTEIRVEAAGEGGAVVVRVLDRGVGIDVESADQLFSPFQRGPSAHEMANGHGLGLTVCRRLVKLQGGEIWARPRPGGGSEFGFSLRPATS